MAVTSAVLSVSSFSASVTYLATTLVGQFLINTAIGVALNALAPKPKRPTTSRGYQVTQRGAALDHQIIYGRVRTGSVVVFDGTTGNNNKFLHRVLAFAGHEVNSFDEIYINDSKVTNLESDGNVKEVTDPDGNTSGRYDGKLRIKKHLGSPTQTADSDLVSEVTDWTSDHRLQGIAYLYARFKFDQDTFPNGVPEITATIKGKSVYDPRSDTTTYSDNPALCLRDYLTNSYGLDEDTTSMDDTLVSTAANVCDETNTISGAKRYTCNGAFTTGTTPYDLLNEMLTSMGGLLWYAQGKWRMKPAYYVAPTVTFTEDDLRSNIQVKTRHSRRDNFNTVRGTFRGEESNWQVTDFPEVTNSSFLSVDNNQESVMDLDLPFTDTADESRRIARIALERNRQQLTVSAAFGLKGFKTQVGDIVKLTVDRFGWSEKEFEVVSWTFGLVGDYDLQVQMTLREISASVFDEVDDGIVYERDNTTLLSPFFVPLPTLNAATVSSEVNADGTTVPQIHFSWSVVDRDSVDYFIFEWKLSSNTDYNTVTLAGNEFTLDPAISGAAYDYRIRTVNHLGVRSVYISSVSPVSTGDDGTIPNPPTGLTAVVGLEALQLTWVAPTQNTDSSSAQDIFQYRIYRHTSNDFGTASLIGRVSADVFTDSALTGGQTYYYWVTAMDYTGNESSESVVATETAGEVVTARNNAVFYIGVTTLPTTSSGAHTDFTNAIGDPVDLDQAWFYTGTLANPTAQSVWIYEEGSGATPSDSWNKQEEVIDGDLIVSGTVTADKINVSQLDAISANIGTFTSAATGERVEISDDVIKVFDASDVVRVVIGDLT